VVRTLAPALYLAVWGFVFLSAATAEALGLARLRVVVFSALMGALLLLALAGRPRLSARGRGMAVALLALYWVMVTLHPGVPFDPLDHKILPVLAVLLLAPELARLLAGVVRPRRLLVLLAGYFLASAVLLAVKGGDAFARGAGGVVRVDVSGSMIVHAALAAVFLPVALTALVHEARALRRALLLGVVALALVMLFLTATRTALLTLLLFALLDLAAGPWRGRAVRLALAAGAGAVVFTLFTLFVNDALWLRLVGAGPGDWTSGRAAALAHWTALAFDHPLGLGIGAVRRLFAEGRPMLDGARPLEWPHDEFVRFWVEGGLFGLAFALLLVGGLVVRAVAAAREAPDPLDRALLLALAADLLAQSLLQNYFNNVYQATAGVLTLVVLAGRVRCGAESGDAPAPVAAGGTAVATGVR